MRMVRGWGSSTRPDSSLSIVVGLSPALSASSRCDSKRLSRTFRSLSPLMRGMPSRIVQTSLPFASLSSSKCGVNHQKCCKTVANVIRCGYSYEKGLAGDGAPRGLAHRRKGVHCGRDKDIARRRRFPRGSQRSSPHSRRTSRARLLFCLEGWVFLGSIDHDGWEVFEAIRCRRCGGTGRIEDREAAGYLMKVYRLTAWMMVST